MTYGTGSYGSTPYGAGDDAGLTLYWAIQPSGTANWADDETGGAQIRAGQDGAGSALPAGSYGSQAYTAAGEIDMADAASGLTPNTNYEFGFVLYDPAVAVEADRYSNVVVSSAFTTALLISGVPAAVTIAGQAALISVGRQVNATPATVSVATSSASVISGVGAGTLLGTTPASVVLASSSAQIIVGKVLNTSPASLSVNGASALVTNSAITVYLRAGSWIRYIQL